MNEREKRTKEKDELSVNASVVARIPANSKQTTASKVAIIIGRQASFLLLSEKSIETWNSLSSHLTYVLLSFLVVGKISNLVNAGSSFSIRRLLI